MEQAIYDEFFGEIKYTKPANCYGCEFDFDGDLIELSFMVDWDTMDFDQIIESAKAFCKNLMMWDVKAQTYAADELLEVKNDAWREEFEEPVTREFFQFQMRLESIFFYEEGDFDLWYNDGGIFEGRQIQLSGNLYSGFENAEIAD